MTLTRDEILAAGKPKAAEVEIDGLGKVCVRQWTFREQQMFRQMLRADDYDTRARAIPWAIAQCILDNPDGARVFNGDADVAALGHLNGDAITAIFQKIARFSEADDEAVDRAGKA